jgi:hypothetical protein
MSAPRLASEGRSSSDSMALGLLAGGRRRSGPPSPPEGGPLPVVICVLALRPYTNDHFRTVQPARARGRVGGHKAKLTPAKVADIRARYEAKESVQGIADYFGVSRPTIYRALETTEA